jgi:hypothetical protein
VASFTRPAPNWTSELRKIEVKITRNMSGYTRAKNAAAGLRQ